MKAILEMNKCILLAGALLVSLGMSAQAGETMLGDFVRNGDNSIRNIMQSSAERVCAEQGSRLPNARELALHAQSLGARGIRDTSLPGQQVTNIKVRAEIEHMERDGFEVVYSLNSAGRAVVDFYFSSVGFQNPAEELRYYRLWSSSAHPDDSLDNTYGAVYVLHSNGKLGYVSRYSAIGTARCASKPR